MVWFVGLWLWRCLAAAIASFPDCGAVDVAFTAAYEVEMERDRAAAARKAEASRSKQRTAELLDEIAPKAAAGTREALLDKRREVAARTHGATRDREEGMDGLDMGDKDVLGSDGRAEYQRALAAQQARRDRGQQAKGERLSALQVPHGWSVCVCRGRWADELIGDGLMIC